MVIHSKFKDGLKKKYKLKELGEHIFVQLVDKQLLSLKQEFSQMKRVLKIGLLNTYLLTHLKANMVILDRRKQ